MPEYPVSATRMPSSGSARVISAHRRSGRIGAALLASVGARSSRQAATMPAARSANARVARTGRAERREQLRQRRLRIAHQSQRVLVAAAKLRRVDVDLHHLGVERGNAPGVRHLVAGVAADEQHEIRLVHDLVGGRRGIVSRATNRQAMPRRDRCRARPARCRSAPPAPHRAPAPPVRRPMRQRPRRRR